ncbi:MAG TPA: class I SAM-dependent methyltransferase [Micromonosporaceae bacterium]|jgi:SAM-dependent methyltransferase
MTSALACYGAALRRAATGDAAEVRLIDPHGHRTPVRHVVGQWCELRAGDAGLLARCDGPTLDVGCGPGRLVAALSAMWIPALGIDVSSEAVRQARRRGAPAQLACVLTADLHLDLWWHILLIDGNIGIGGDPARLLRRCRDLLCTGGDILVELEAPGVPSWCGPVALAFGDSVSTPFAWAAVAADDLAALAVEVELYVAETWTEADRWFARLTRG